MLNYSSMQGAPIGGMRVLEESELQYVSGGSPATDAAQCAAGFAAAIASDGFVAVATGFSAVAACIAAIEGLATASAASANCVADNPCADASADGSDGNGSASSGSGGCGGGDCASTD